ncbi:hypothetical protein [Mycobacterium sp. 1465703.0]|uniref:hypothetical protein n=1 Tax=Mycobacterium sp. 1465703.0 TaxID=1834078 RepID=UPI0008025275|nr:hypothetical protein [Mycobacterium sp. 1465703.0]OBJ08352.1 hypothetical protein A5625_15255 [Mycobacterium sp. 1465703.0]
MLHNIWSGDGTPAHPVVAAWWLAQAARRRGGHAARPLENPFDYRDLEDGRAEAVARFAGWIVNPASAPIRGGTTT